MQDMEMPSATRTWKSLQAHHMILKAEISPPKGELGAPSLCLLLDFQFMPHVGNCCWEPCTPNNYLHNPRR